MMEPPNSGNDSLAVVATRDDSSILSSSSDLRHRFLLNRSANNPEGTSPNFGADTEADCGEDIASTSRKRKRMKSAKVNNISYRDFSKASLEEVSRQLGVNAAGCGSHDNHNSINDGAVGGDGGRLVQNKTTSFPRKLYEMVTNPEYQHIICFMPHGRSWMVLDRKALISEVLPKYFNHSKYESFNRQVNGWGFNRLLNRGPDHKSYYHECFLRGRPELSTLMFRLVTPGKRISDRDHELDFYAISRLNPLPEIEMGSAVQFYPTKLVYSPVATVENMKTSSRKNSVKHAGNEVSLPLVRNSSGVSMDDTPGLLHQTPMPAQSASAGVRDTAVAEAFKLYQTASNLQFTSNYMSYITTGEMSLANAFPSNHDPFKLQKAANAESTTGSVQSSSIDCLEKAFLSSKPNFTGRSPSFMSKSSYGPPSGKSVEELSSNEFDPSMIIEPDPFLEDVPIKVLAVNADMDDQGEGLCKIQKPTDPLLKEFAEIYFSSDGTSDEC